MSNELARRIAITIGALLGWAALLRARRLDEPGRARAVATIERNAPIEARMHDRLVTEGCGRYQTSTNKHTIGSGDKASYEAWQAKYNRDHNKGWSGSALNWPPGKESWDALRVPKGA